MKCVSLALKLHMYLFFCGGFPEADAFTKRAANALSCDTSKLTKPVAPPYHLLAVSLILQRIVIVKIVLSMSSSQCSFCNRRQSVCVLHSQMLWQQIIQP